MIAFVRTGVVAPGKNHEAMRLAHQGVKMVADKLGTKLSISVRIGGEAQKAFIPASSCAGSMCMSQTDADLRE